MKKLLSAGIALWAFACVLNAAPIVRIDFPCQNFWGHMTCLDELPNGVWVAERATFWDKKRKGYDFPVFVDLAKVGQFELTFKFKGSGMARMTPEITGYADDGRTKKADLRLVEFSIDGDRSARAPATFNSYYGVTPFVAAADREINPGVAVKAGQKYHQIYVTDGKIIKVKAKFGK